MDETVSVHVAAVTGVHPAVSQRGIGCIRFFPVPEHHIRAAHDHFTDSTTRHFAVVGIDDAHFGAGRRQPGGIHLAAGLVLGAVVFAAQGGGHGRQLGHAVTLEKLRTRKGAASPVQQCRRNSRCAVIQGGQRAKVQRSGLQMTVAPVQQHLDHGGCQQNLVDPFLGDGLQYPARLEHR
ncbi:hypothetical protein D3C80_1516160 [compost metagenome]